MLSLLISLLCVPAHAGEAAPFDAAAEQRVCESYAELDTLLRSRAGSGEGADGCGPKGYLLDYGRFYCSRFVAWNSSFSPAGQLAMRNIRHCLAGSLRIQRAQLTCENVRQAGIESHFGCYMRSGYCQLTFAEKSKVHFLLGDSIGFAALVAGGKIWWGCRQQGAPDLD